LKGYLPAVELWVPAGNQRCHREKTKRPPNQIDFLNSPGEGEASGGHRATWHLAN